MKNIKYILGVIILLIMASVLYFKFPITQSQRLNGECEKFGEKYLKEHKDIVSESSKINFFYSNRLDTCVMSTTDEFNNEFFISDIQNNYLRDIKNVFWCDKDGIDNVVLEKAEKFNGYLFNESYKDFLDNGEGGESRTLKAPVKPYTREQCQYFFSKKLNEIK